MLRRTVLSQPFLACGNGCVPVLHACWHASLMLVKEYDVLQSLYVAAQDFCYVTGTPPEQFALYKQQWQQSNRDRFSNVAGNDTERSHGP